jgi:predicted nicotinamide N-methyase
MKLPLLLNGVALTLATAEGVLGGTVWPAAAALCRHLSRHRTLLLSSRPSCVELGSGTGAVGLYAAGLGFQVTLTEHKPPLSAVMNDVAYNVDGTLDSDIFLQNGATKSDRLINLLQTNLDHNAALFSILPKIQELDWTNNQQATQLLQELTTSTNTNTTPKQGFDLILASDVTYQSQVHSDLAATISRLLLKPSNDDGIVAGKCLVSHQQRIMSIRSIDYQRQSFQEAIEHEGLAITNESHELVVDDDDDHYKTHKISILTVEHADFCEERR